MKRLFPCALVAFVLLSCESQVQNLPRDPDDDIPPGYADVVIGPISSNGEVDVAIATVEDPSYGTIRCGRKHANNPNQENWCKKQSRIMWSIENYSGVEVEVELLRFKNETTDVEESPFAGPLKRDIENEGRRPIWKRVRNNANGGIYKYHIVVKNKTTGALLKDLDPRIDIE